MTSKVLINKFEQFIPKHRKFTTLDGLLYSSLVPISQLRKFLQKNCDKIRGTKKELIRRILKNVNYDLCSILKQLLPRNSLF